MCVLGTLNAFPFDKQIYIYVFTSAKAQWGLLNLSEVRSPKLEFRMAAKKLIREIPINLL